MIHMYAVAFAASFIFIFLKAWQQLNIVHKKYWLILPTSVAMATCEVFVIVNMAKNGWGFIVIAVGSGAGLGAMLATYLHSILAEGGKKE